MGEPELFVGKRYSDSICASCSRVGWEAADTGALRPQPQSAHRHNARERNCSFITMAADRRSAKQAFVTEARPSSQARKRIVGVVAHDTRLHCRDVAVRVRHIASFVVAKR